MSTVSAVSIHPIGSSAMDNLQKLMFSWYVPSLWKRWPYHYTTCELSWFSLNPFIHSYRKDRIHLGLQINRYITVHSRHIYISKLMYFLLYIEVSSCDSNRSINSISLIKPRARYPKISLETYSWLSYNSRTLGIYTMGNEYLHFHEMCETLLFRLKYGSEVKNYQCRRR